MPRYLFAVVLVLLCSGCSVPRGRVSGKVTYQGRPLREGTIIFLAQDNQVYPTPIRADGTYSLEAVPRGKLGVSIQVAEPRPTPRANPGAKAMLPGQDAAADDAAKMARMPPGPKSPSTHRIPARYADPKQSGLTYDLIGAEGEFDIELTGS